MGINKQGPCAPMTTWSMTIALAARHSLDSPDSTLTCISYGPRCLVLRVRCQLLLCFWYLLLPATSLYCTLLDTKGMERLRGGGIAQQGLRDGLGHNTYSHSRGWHGESYGQAAAIRRLGA